MHPSAFKTGKRFFDAYAGQSGTVIDIGALNVNGSLKDVCPKHLKYVGVDFAAGAGVDVVLEDPYKLPFENASADMAVSSSCFEHSEMFWLLFLEILRILKPDGLFYLNAPSNGIFHRHPVDCWRFYPDSGNALVTWAARNGYDPLLLESFVGRQDRDMWNDFVAVFVRERKFAAKHPKRILDSYAQFTNGIRAGSAEMLNHAEVTEDQQQLRIIRKVAAGAIKVKLP